MRCVGADGPIDVDCFELYCCWYGDWGRRLEQAVSVCPMLIFDNGITAIADNQFHIS